MQNFDGQEQSANDDQRQSLVQNVGSNPPQSSKVLGLSCVFYLPFMIADLVFGYSDYLCVRLVPFNVVSFDLATWLLVDGYCKLGMLLLSIGYAVLLIACIAKG